MKTTFASALTLLATFAALAVGLPVVNHDPLAPENFDLTLAHGVWLVEYFSPYCGHCVSFAPTWNQFVKEMEALSNPGISFAQVNCALHGDFCTDKNVDGWPSIFLYKDGAYVEKFKGSRDLSRLKDFATNHAEPSHASVEVAKPTTLQGTAQTTIQPAPVVTTRVQPPLHVQTPRAAANLDGAVRTLDEENFQVAVEQGPVFVKFYAPWCGHCKKLAPIWTQFAKVMQNKLAVAEVNCDDHGALCQSQGINGYPVLQLYAYGAKTEYNGGRELDQLRAFGERVSAPPVQELILDELPKHVSENPVVFLLLHSASDSHVLNDVTQAAQVLFGSPPVYSSTSQELYRRFHIPANTPWALVALKDHESSSASSIFYMASRTNLQDGLATWLQRHSLPTMTELSQDTFQSVMSAKHKPLVVITATHPSMMERVKSEMRTVSVKWKLSEIGKARAETVVFTWMDSERWAHWLKSMYGVQEGTGEDGVSVVVVDHSRLIYWDQDQHGEKIELNPSSILSAIEGIQNKSIKYKYSENLVERMIRNIHRYVTALEYYLKNYPFRFVFFLAVSFLVLFLVLRRCVSDEVADIRGHPRKSERLD